MVAEELIPGLVKVAEARLGKVGRPLTTAMVFLAIVGIMAWGADMVFSKIIAPVLKVTGIHEDSELMASIAILIILTIVVVGAVVFTSYGVQWIKDSRLRARLQRQEEELKELRQLVESRERESEDG